MCCLHLQGRTISQTNNQEEQATNRAGWRKMEGMLFCRKSADFYQSTRHHIPADSLYNYCCGNLK
jgi:hypothetical protein